MKLAMMDITCPIWALCLLHVPIVHASKLRWSPRDLFIFAEEVITRNACSSFDCPTNYRPKYNPQVNGTPSAAKCCNPTCALWTCTSGHKANAAYSGNEGASNQICCDQTCALNTDCPAGFAVPTSLRDAAGGSATECCRPKCSQHSCFNKWTQDLSKKDVAASSNSECCQPSCMSVACSRASGLAYWQDKMDKPGNTTDYCCQKRCKAYSSQCPSHTGVQESKEDTRVEASSTSAALSQCCDAKCSGKTCPSGYTLKGSLIRDMFEDQAQGYGGCCAKTCAAHTCSSGWTRAATRINNTMPSDANCCEPSAATCGHYDCGLVGRHNVTDSSTLASTNTSRENCCQNTCRGTPCPAGKAAIAGSGGLAATSVIVCCETQICAVMRAANRLAVVANLSDSSNSTDGCNGLSQGTCPSRYDSVNNSGNLTLTPCAWDATLSICSMNEAQSADDCAAMS